MPDLVINTGPIIALVAAVGHLRFLDTIYTDILLPREVFAELEAGGVDCAELKAIKGTKVIHQIEKEVRLPKLLQSQLDLGEASVIQNAVNYKTQTVAIDEKAGRRVARLNGLRVTGSVGILIKASKAEVVSDIDACFQRMRASGIWISDDLVKLALKELEK